MVTKDEALKKIIEMWEYGDFLDSSSGLDEFDEAIQACKEALEQPSWQGLSDDEINDIKTKTIMGANGMSVEQLLGLIVSLTEQALRNKNGY